MCVNFLSQEQKAPSAAQIRQCGVDLSLDSSGHPHSAVARTKLYPESQYISYETRIAFQICDGVGRFQGIVEPNQPSWPHFNTLPAACTHVANINEVRSVEQPEEPLSRLFEQGRWIAHTDSELDEPR